jgi:hypothetical protein
LRDCACPQRRHRQRAHPCLGGGGTLSQCRSELAETVALATGPMPTVERSSASSLAELGKLNRRQFSALVGVAPFAQDPRGDGA